MISGLLKVETHSRNSAEALLISLMIKQ